MIIDFHNHFYPKEYLNALKSGNYAAGIQQDSSGQTVMVLPGDYNVIVEEHYNAAARLEAMEVAGIERQLLTFTIPGVHGEAKDAGIQLAQIINNAFAGICQQYPNRFAALAALPLQSPADSVRELERAVAQLGLKGGGLFTHTNGVPLDDPAYLPLFEKAVELDVPLFIHPFIPTHIGNQKDYRIVALTGFLHETTVAVSRLAFSGLLHRLPDLKLVLSHMGGALPFVAERLDVGYRVYPECRLNLAEPPSAALQNLYMDTYPGAPRAIEFAIQFAGADKLVMGSDYPHQIGDLAGGLTTINELAISAKEKAAILGGNAKQLLNWD